MTRPYGITGDNGGTEPRPRLVALGNSPGGNTGSVPAVTRLWTMARSYTCTT